MWQSAGHEISFNPFVLNQIPPGFAKNQRFRKKKKEEKSSELYEELTTVSKLDFYLINYASKDFELCTTTQARILKTVPKI